MKTKLLLIAFAWLPLFAAAQEIQPEPVSTTDTTVYINGRKYVIKENDNKLNIKVFGETSKGDTINDDMIYEATYNDEQTTERRFEFSVPFMKQKSHDSDQICWFNEISLGFSGLSGSFGMGDNDVADLKYSRSHEINVNLLSGRFHLTEDGHWLFTPGIRWNYSTYRLNGNYAFVDNDGVTSVAHGTVDTEYAVSRLRYNAFRFPVAMQWQSSERHSRLVLQAGLEPEWRFKIRSWSKVNGDKEVLGRDMNVYPLGLNVFAKATFCKLGFYVRCSTTNMFRDNQGPKLYPWSWGLVWDL